MNANVNDPGKKSDATRKMEDFGKKTEDLGKKATETGVQGAHQAQEMLMGFNNSVMKAFDQNRSAAHHMLRAMQEESLRFVNMRFEHTSRALERSRDYQGFSGFITLQQDWLLDFARDYAEFNKRFGELLQEMADHRVENGHDMINQAVHTSKTVADRAAA
jgi:hypothetical protein